MIQISHLTEEQVEMLNIMWELDTEEDYLNWHACLDKDQQVMADGLTRLIIQESMEQMLEETQYKDAKEVLSKFAL
jgi:hypothetical protein